MIEIRDRVHHLQLFKVAVLKLMTNFRTFRADLTVEEFTLMENLRFQMRVHALLFQTVKVNFSWRT